MNKSIYFRGPKDLVDQQVRATLDGTKTQFRLPCKHQPPDDRYVISTLLSTTGDKKDIGKKHWVLTNEKQTNVIDSSQPYFSAPYKEGDRLVLKEAFVLTNRGKPVFRSDCKDANGYFWSSIAEDKSDVIWKPPMHMPPEYSRATLEITRVWLERVQDISEEDAVKEGFETDLGGFCFSARLSFKIYWIYLHNLKSWSRNDWVWAYEFRRV